MSKSGKKSILEKNLTLKSPIIFAIFQDGPRSFFFSNQEYKLSLLVD